MSLLDDEKDLITSADIEVIKNVNNINKKHEHYIYTGGKYVCFLKKDGSISRKRITHRTVYVRSIKGKKTTSQNHSIEFACVYKYSGKDRLNHYEILSSHYPILISGCFTDFPESFIIDVPKGSREIIFFLDGCRKDIRLPKLSDNNVKIHIIRNNE